VYEDQPPVQPSPPPDTSPRSFMDMPELWLKILQMSEDFFALEAPRANGSTVLISVLVMAIITAVLSTISSLLWGGAQTMMMSEQYREAAAVGLGSSALCGVCGGLVGGILGFYLSTGINYLGARAFGGTGDFGTQSYLQSLFVVPIGIVSALVGLVPYLGIAVGLGLSLYAIVLNVRVVKVVHRLTTGKAVAALIVPGLVLMVVVACIVVVVLILLGPVIGNIFSDVYGGMY
jgi:hypothetical protein